MQHLFRTMERVLIWPLMACALAIAGYQAGLFGAGLVYPDVAQEDVADASAQDFAALATDAAARSDATVAPLFGVPSQNVAAPAPETPEIVPNKTYHLQGITVAGSQRWAMLTSGGSTWLVRPGDTLESGESVQEITNQSVLLDAGGTLTILRFARASQDGQLTEKSMDASVLADLNPEPSEPATPRVTRVAPTETPEAAEPVDVEQAALPMQALRRALYAPDALSSVRFAPARLGNGGVGWRLKWIADSPLVQAAGLQRGDVLRAINGVEITDATGLQGLITTLARMEEIVILFERNGAPMRSIIPLDRNG